MLKARIIISSLGSDSVSSVRLVFKFQPWVTLQNLICTEVCLGEILWTVSFTFCVHLCWLGFPSLFPNTWHKQLKAGRVNSGSQFQGLLSVVT